MNKPQTFTIETRGAGQGGVGLSVVGPTEPKIGCVDNHDGTLTVEYLPNTVGSYEIAVAFADQPVPGRWSLLLVQCSVLLVTFTLTATYIHRRSAGSVTHSDTSTASQSGRRRQDSCNVVYCSV